MKLIIKLRNWLQKFVPQSKSTVASEFCNSPIIV